MKKKLRINRFIIIAVLIYFIYTLFSQQQTLNSYKQEASTYSNQIEEANEKNDELKNVKNNINSTEYIENNEQKRGMLDALNSGCYYNLTNADELFVQESELINDLAKNESCVIIGRCSDFILKDNKDVINIFVYSTMENKIERAVERYNLSKKEAEKEIKNIDKLRSNHYKHYTGKVWGENKNYDLCINSDTFGVEKAADMICEIAMKK